MFCDTLAMPVIIISDEEEEGVKLSAPKRKSVASSSKAPAKGVPETVQPKPKAGTGAASKDETTKPKFRSVLCGSVIRPVSDMHYVHSWAAAKAAKLAGPVAPGSKVVPEPASPDCLAGLAFVFTGELSSFSRDEAVDIAKRYGGQVFSIQIQTTTGVAYFRMQSRGWAAIIQNGLRYSWRQRWSQQTRGY